MKRDEIPTPKPDHQAASAAVTAALGTLPFPIAKDEAMRRVGKWQVPLDAATDSKMPLRDLLRALPMDEFRDEAEAARAIDAHWGRIAETLADAERDKKTRRAKK